MRAGEHGVRSPHHGIREFDALADQWNRLLDERAAAEEQNRILAKLMETAPLGIEVTDAAGRILYVNPALERMSGYSLGAMVGRAFHDLAPSVEHPMLAWQEVLTVLSQHRTWRGIVDFRRCDGSVLVCDLTLCPILDERGALHRVIAVRHDITALKQHEHDLEEARLKAEAANQAKSAFIANTNHEIRTPLNAIVGFSEMLASERLGPLGTPEYREFAGLLESSARSLLSIVNTIMDLSRLQSGCAPLNIEAFDPVETVARVLRQWEAKAKERGLDIGLRATTRGHRLKADEQRLMKIVDNLVSNAVKFSRDGGRVRVGLRLDRQRRFVLTVADDGIGIAREHVGEVTEPFFQADKSLARATGGIGLGLTVVKECAALHGATLDIKSRPGKGTRVDVVFPAAATERRPAMPRPARRRVSTAPPLAA
jgi:PAS domain S-box-containing protein